MPVAIARVDAAGLTLRGIARFEPGELQVVAKLAAVVMRGGDAQDASDLAAAAE